jgi:nucleoside 2-deoxyribosyltransferase
MPNHKKDVPKIELYIASNLGFSESGRYFLYNSLIPLVKDTGFSILDPWKLTPEELIKNALKIRNEEKRRTKLVKINKIIGRNNEIAIRKSSGILAIIDGQEIDSGVAGEIGFAYGLEKPIIAYRNDFRQSGENSGTIINLQLEYFISKRGFIVTSLDELEEKLENFHNFLSQRI